MLQNRVTPFGEIVFSPQRGTFTGNRGVLHNEKQQLVRTFKTKAWITCLLDYKGFKRQVMTPNRWTELFFWDEATAFAAGHRPCAFCRNPDFKLFKRLWIEANAPFFNLPDDKITSIDALLHQERTEKRLFEAPVTSLPDGVFVSKPDDLLTAYLRFQNQFWQWTEQGYLAAEPGFPETVRVLTPESVVRVLEKGYQPQVHPGLVALLKESERHK